MQSCVLCCFSVRLDPPHFAQITSVGSGPPWSAFLLRLEKPGVAIVRSAVADPSAVEYSGVDNVTDLGTVSLLLRRR